MMHERPRGAAPAPVIEARELCKRHLVGEVAVEALSGVTLRIEHGELVAIVGPSGSGKSTLLGLIGTLDAPTSGELFIDGVPTRALDARQLARLRGSSIGFVFQNFHLLPRATALEQVLLPAQYGHRGGRGELGRRAREKLDFVGLADRAGHLPSQLSGGQQQRVAIARALMNEPSIVLADEPTGALDQATGREIIDLLVRLNASGVTVVIVTHDPAVAARARRVVAVRDGRIVSDDRLKAAITDEVSR